MRYKQVKQNFSRKTWHICLEIVSYGRSKRTAFLQKKKMTVLPQSYVNSNPYIQKFLKLYA